MTLRTFDGGIFRRSLVALTCFVLITGSAPGLFAQATSAAISGVILDPEGKPVFGFKVLLRDIGSNTKYMSGPTDAAGNYAVQVPVGGRYKVEGVVADDGLTNLPVQDVPPISVLTPGTTRLNVRFTSAPAAASTAKPPARAPATAAREKPMTTKAKPWYKRPGPITGMVVGGVLVVALAAGGGGGGGGAVSPSTSSQ